MANHEQHEMLCGILASLVPVLSVEELSLLSHSCGIQISEFYEPQVIQMRIAA